MKTTFALLTAIALLAVARPSPAEEPFAPGTDTEVLTLLNLTRFDGHQLEFEGETESATIRVVRDADGVRYEYKSHRLSCGTLMTGSIRERKHDGKTLVQAKFSLAKNPWHIVSIEGELPADAQTIQRAGTILVNEKPLALK